MGEYTGAYLINTQNKNKYISSNNNTIFKKQNMATLLREVNSQDMEKNAASQSNLVVPLQL